MSFSTGNRLGAVSPNGTNQYLSIHKRGFAGDGPTPPPVPDDQTTVTVDPANYGLTGYGEIRGEMRSIWGNDLKEAQDFPPDADQLIRGRWFNYDDQPLPPYITTSAEQNQRIWADLEIERMLDHHPPHEVHADSLPDYHYFPQIQKELDAPPAEGGASSVSKQYGHDVTDVPRFFRTGIPKTPLQSQDWYVPRKADGRFDWRENIRKNGYSASLFDASGWDRRFLVPLNRLNMPMHTMGFRQYASMPQFFRVSELPLSTRMCRHFMGSQFDKHLIFVGLYTAGLLWASAMGAHWCQLAWENEPFNYDMTYMQNIRGKGGFHGII